MGAHLDALRRFKLTAKGLHGGSDDTPDMTAGFAAAALRYLKDVVGKLKSDPCEPWQGVGEGIARTPFASKLPADARDRFWSWALCVCQAADEQNVTFAAVHPDPTADYAALRKKLGVNGTVAPVDDNPSPSTTPVEDDDDLDLDASGKKPPPKSQANTALFLIAAILLLGLAHRAR